VAHLFENELTDIISSNINQDIRPASSVEVSN